MATQNVIQFQGKRDELTSVSKIVVAYDFSAAADHALADAVTLAKRFQAEIVLAHVEPEERGVLHMQPRGGQNMRARLEEMAARITQDGLLCRAESRTGTVVPALVCIAGEEDADLMLAGAYGNGQKQGVGIGSTAAQLLRRMERPVLMYSPVTIKPAFQEQVSDILMPIEFLLDPHSTRLAANAARLFNARLDILHVVDVRNLPSMPNAAQDMQYNCDKLAAHLRCEGVKASSVLVFGKPDEMILERSRAMHCSLILLPLASREHHTSDGVAASVIRNAEVPVLTCRIDEYPEWRYGYSDQIAS